MTFNVKFSKNWNNKLSLDIFPTIRKYTPDKFKYYESLKGQTGNIILNGKFYCRATLIAVETRPFHTIPREMLILDTGLEGERAVCVFEDFGIGLHDTTIILVLRKAN